MASFATCKFPMVDRFKDYGEKNIVVGYIDSVLSGFGQIVLSDNPVTGLLIILGVFLASPSQCLTALWAGCVASLFAYLIGVNKVLVQHGLYTFSGAVVGLGISLWGFTNQAEYLHLLIYATIGGILSVCMTAAFNGLLSKWEAPSLSVPYCMTLAIIMPALFLMSGVNSTPMLTPYTVEITEAFTNLTPYEFVLSALAGVGEICFQTKVSSCICLILAILISSRVDAIVAILCSIIGCGFAIAIGLPTDNILIGLYGYNSALVGMGLFGRAFRMSVPSAIFTIIMALLSVILTVSMGVVFAPLGIPVAALPFGIIVIACIIGREHLAVLKPVSILLWGVPETIQKAVKEQDLAEAKAN